jgi:hypothetical protein
MLQVNRWVASRPDIDGAEEAELLSQIIEQACIMYGDGFAPPADDQRTSFLARQKELSDDPPQFIADLRELLEKPTDVSLNNQGEDSDQKILDQEIQLEEPQQFNQWQQFGSAEPHEPDHSGTDPGGDTAPGRVLPLDWL